MNNFVSRDFLDYFRDVLDNDDDVRMCRAVTNRAYLAAYLHVKQILKNLGYRFRNNHKDYHLLEDYLIRHNMDRGPGLSQIIRQLRQKRVDADYDYSPQYLTNRRKARKTIKISKELIRNADRFL